MIRFLLGTIVLVSVFSCGSEPQPQEKDAHRRTIDPSQIKIDVERGGVVTPDGVLLQFKKTGKGEKILLVPNATYLADDFKALEQDYTVIYYDMRNRGRSRAIQTTEKLEPGIWNDVQDLEAIRRHFQFGQVYLIGHSYLGVVTALYARRYPEHVAGLILISPLPPDLEKDYPNRYQDTVGLAVQRELSDLEQQREDLSAGEYCRQWWGSMKKMYVADPQNTRKIRTNICQYPNERPDRMLQHLQQYIFPSLQKLELNRSELAKVEAPVLILHGSKDRVAPLGGARDWQRLLPDAQLVEVENAGHLPWVEGEETVFATIRAFLEE